MKKFGFDFDDAVSYPYHYSTSSLFIIEEGQNICRSYLDNKNLILIRIVVYYQYGYFPSIPEDTRRMSNVNEPSSSYQYGTHRLDTWYYGRHQRRLATRWEDPELYRNAGGCTIC